MDKREQILVVASNLFSKNGYENTPLSLVCEKANVSKGLIFHHFKSKDVLLREIFKQTTDLILEINSKNQSSLSPQERIRALLESYSSQLEDEKDRFKFNLNLILQPNTKAILGDLISIRADAILKSVKSIFDEIDPENSLEMSHVLIAEMDGIALHYLSIYEHFPLKSIMRSLIKKYA